MTKVTKELKEKILNDPLLDTEEIIWEARKLIDCINAAERYSLFEQEKGKIHLNSLLNDGEFTEIQSPSPDSDWEKIIQVLQKNGISLDELVSHEERIRQKWRNKLIAKSQELKSKVLSDISKWSIGYSLSEDDFTEEDYQEIKQAIVERIKQNPGEWTIKKMFTSKGGIYGIWQKDILLVHQSFVVEYDDEYGELLVEHGKVHWKNSFSDQQWNEIEQVVSKDFLLHFAPFPVFLVASISLLFLGLLIFVKRRRNRKNKQASIFKQNKHC